MAAINDLLRQISDSALRERLNQEVARLNKNKKFGLVFEEHIPECTPLYDIPIRKGSIVAEKSGKIIDLYTVLEIYGDLAKCFHKNSSEIKEFSINELVSVAQFGDPIFPSLIPIAKVENASDSGLWHTLIEADNYHALQLLEYLYPKQVDCIYIDPPYNTGARDWKYNNDYVDSADNWRHSKWLSMMQKRLKIAKRILNPDTGVLIVTIDENEVHHLRTLLKEIFPEAIIQMVTIVINPKGIFQGRFSRVEEHAIFCFMPNAKLSSSKDPLLGEVSPVKKPRWKGLLRSGSRAAREHTYSEFYPILVDASVGRVIKALEPPSKDYHPVFGEKIDGYDVAWPIRSDGSEGLWGVTTSTLNALIEKGYVSLGRYDSKRQTWGLSYLTSGPQRQIETGELQIIGYDEVRNVIDVEYADSKDRQVKTVWYRTLHDAGAYGSDLIKEVLGQAGVFSFPKSLYSTKDAVASVVRDNPNALIVDFFAGSGTTLHAVNLMNAEDGGNRRCIIVTNNEVSETEATSLKSAGYQPGDPEWEKNGICRSVTWPRTENSILGKRYDGTVLTGEYYTSKTTTKEITRTFYQLGFVENSTDLTLTAKKQIIASICGQATSAQKKVNRISDTSKAVKSAINDSLLPQSLAKANSRFIVSEKHTASILFDTGAVDDWLAALDDQDHITDFYIVEKDSRTFNGIKEKVIELLGTVTVSETLKRPMSEGFPANVEYFKLGFLDKNSVSLGRQFREVLPMLWLKSGAIGKRPNITTNDEPDYMILPQNGFAILVDETKYAEFCEQLSEVECLETIYFVTNSEEAFREMTAGVKANNTYQLYRDYIDNFVLGSRRDS